MSRAFWVSKDMMRSARVGELPASLFKKFDEFGAFHGVYYTHHPAKTALHGTNTYVLGLCRCRDCVMLREAAASSDIWILRLRFTTRRMTKKRDGMQGVSGAEHEHFLAKMNSFKQNHYGMAVILASHFCENLHARIR